MSGVCGAFGRRPIIDRRPDEIWHAGLETRSGTYVRVLFPAADVPAVEVETLLRRLDRRTAALLARLKGAKLAAPISVVLYPDFVVKGRLTGSTREAEATVSAERGAEVRAVWGEATEPACEHAVALAIVRQVAPLPNRPWLERGRAAALCGEWMDEPLAIWGEWLTSADAWPDFAELLGEREESDQSPLVMVAGAALLMARADGAGMVPRLGSRPRRDLEPLWSAVTSSYGRARARPVPSALPAGIQRGVSYALTNRLESSFVSAASRASLLHLRSLGTDWVSVMPFGFQESLQSTRIHFVHRSPAGETDEAMARVIRDAHALGIEVFYKPHLWISRNDWSGHLSMRSEAEWRQWFSSYRRYIAHHALVARLHGADQFAVGVELGGTVGHESEWRRVIATARALFPGPLTYCSNWDEAGRVGFWDGLDAVGVNAYFPLSANPAASDVELAAGAAAFVETLAGIAKRTRLPLLVTEIGYPAITGSWMHPHQEDASRPLDDEAQARAVGAAGAALLGKPGSTWLRGIYWWKYESDPGLGKSNDKGFNLRGKPAERVVAGLYATR